MPLGVRVVSLKIKYRIIYDHAKSCGLDINSLTFLLNYYKDNILFEKQFLNKKNNTNNEFLIVKFIIIYNNLEKPMRDDVCSNHSNNYGDMS